LARGEASSQTLSVFKVKKEGEQSSQGKKGEKKKKKKKKKKKEKVQKKKKKEGKQCLLGIGRKKPQTGNYPYQRGGGDKLAGAKKAPYSKKKKPFYIE